SERQDRSPLPALVSNSSCNSTAFRAASSSASAFCPGSWDWAGNSPAKSLGCGASRDSLEGLRCHLYRPIPVVTNIRKATMASSITGRAIRLAAISLQDNRDRWTETFDDSRVSLLRLGVNDRALG